MASRERSTGGRLVLGAISRLGASGKPITFDALARAAGMSKGGVQYWIRVLEAAGKVECDRTPDGRRIDGSLRVGK